MNQTPIPGAGSLRCVRCGYCLDGHDAVAGRLTCPECNTVSRIRLESDEFPRGAMLAGVSLGLAAAGLFMTGAAVAGVVAGGAAYELSEGKRGLRGLVAAGGVALVRGIFEGVLLFT